MIKKLIFFVFLVAYSNASAQANKQDVKTFLELNGNFDIYNDMIDQFVDQLSVSKREAFKKDMNVFLEKIAKKDIEKYASAFSQDEILKLIEFYKSPLGKKLVEKNNEFFKETSEDAQKQYSELQGIVMKYMM